MSWSRIDDNAPLHRKLLKAGGEAAWLWVAGLCFCNRSHTEGVIEKDLLGSVYPAYTAKKARSCARRLVDVNLWHDEGDHYVVHDFEDHNMVGEELEAARRKKSERQRKWRLKRAGVDDVDASTETSTQRLQETSTETSTLARARSAGAGARVTRPVPSLPDPEDSATANAVVSSSRVRALRDDGGEALGLVVRGYRDRYEQATGTPWMAYDANRTEADAVARWVAEHARRQELSPRHVASDLLDGFFADGWAQEHRWPWRRLAKDPARYLGTKGESDLEQRTKRADELNKLKWEASRRGDRAEYERLDLEEHKLRGSGRISAA